MKKIALLSLIGLLWIPGLFSQSCVDDVWMSLRNKQIPKAKKIIDECAIANPDNANVILMKGNVYLQRYQQEQDNLKKNPAYVVKDPEAILIANECFYKALELNPKVEPKTGMLGPRDGQILAADPIYYMGQDALEKKEYDKAFDYLTIAARNFKLDNRNPNLPLNLGLIYLQLSDIAGIKKDQDLQKRMLMEGVRANTPIPNVYLSLYDIYKKENDTVKAGEILKTAHRFVPDSLTTDIYGYELDYYAMVGDMDKLNTTSETLLQKFGDSPAILAMIAGYLNNSGQYEKAEGYIQKGLEKEPNNFDLNQQMAYRYFYEGLKYQDMIDAAMTARKYDEVKDLQAKEKEILENAHTWSEKAYELNKEDRQNNIMLRQLKVKLLKEVPEELKTKVDSYYNN